MSCLECKDQVVDLAQKLLAIPSVYPDTKVVIEYIEQLLREYGFATKIFPVNNCYNLYAQFGNDEKIIGFAGHVDVVPAGMGWSHDPFEPVEINGKIYGRGAVDMKGAIAAWIVAALKIIKENPNKSIALIIAGDEEVSNNAGTLTILHWLQDHNKQIELVIVGEPTNPNKMGEMLKIGRRGSISFDLIIKGMQGHVAYPDQADNPFKYVGGIINNLNAWQIDQGNEHFDPSNLEITSLYTDNQSYNVIPREVNLKFNIRYNNNIDEETLISIVRQLVSSVVGDNYSLEYNNSAQPFITNNQQQVEFVTSILKEINSIAPIASTTGGTSDARFIAKFYPVIEYGLINQTAHKVDEWVGVDDLINLTHSYYRIMQDF